MVEVGVCCIQEIKAIARRNFRSRDLCNTGPAVAGEGSQISCLPVLQLEFCEGGSGWLASCIGSWQDGGCHCTVFAHVVAPTQSPAMPTHRATIVHVVVSTVHSLKHTCTTAVGLTLPLCCNYYCCYFANVAVDRLAILPCKRTGRCRKQRVQR